MKPLSKNSLTILFFAILFVCTTPLKAQRLKEFEFHSGPYIRVGAGYFADLNVGAGYTFPFRLSLGAEVTTWSMFCGVGAMVDARYRFIDNQFSPFVDAKSGFGLLGKTYDNRTYSGFMTSVMGGLSWRGLDLGIGAGYDEFYGFSPVVNLSYTYVFKR